MRQQPLIDELEHVFARGIKWEFFQNFVEAGAGFRPPGKGKDSLAGNFFFFQSSNPVTIWMFFRQTRLEVGETGDDPVPPDVSRELPALTTPQWVGEPGVEAVVVLAIDDMRGHEKWETFLRPIIARLKKIDGRAPISICAC